MKVIIWSCLIEGVVKNEYYGYNEGFSQVYILGLEEIFDIMNI